MYSFFDEAVVENGEIPVKKYLKILFFIRNYLSVFTIKFQPHTIELLGFVFAFVPVDIRRESAYMLQDPAKELVSKIGAIPVF